MQLLASPPVRSARLCWDEEAPLTHRIWASSRWADPESARKSSGEGRTGVGELGKDSGELVEGGHPDETGAKHRVRSREVKDSSRTSPGHPPPQLETSALLSSPEALLCSSSPSGLYTSALAVVAVAHYLLFAFIRC